MKSGVLLRIPVLECYSLPRQGLWCKGTKLFKQYYQARQRFPPALLCYNTARAIYTWWSPFKWRVDTAVATSCASCKFCSGGITLDWYKILSSNRLVILKGYANKLGHWVSNSYQSQRELRAELWLGFCCFKTLAKCSILLKKKVLTQMTMASPVLSARCSHRCCLTLV